MEEHLQREEDGSTTSRINAEHGESKTSVLKMNDKALLCLQDWCSDRDSWCWQIFMLISHIAVFGLSLALVVLWAYVVFPFENPGLGFWPNWMFNFVAHPIANYIVARGILGWCTRQIMCDLEKRPSLCRAERPEITQRVRRSLFWLPLVDSLCCAGEHIILSFANVYPIPFSVPLACIPAAFASMGVFYLLLPQEVRAIRSTGNCLKFTVSAWTVFCGFYAMMLFYIAYFPQMDTGAQLAMSLAVSAVEFLAVKVAVTSGRRWNMPLHIAREIRTCMKLPVIIFKASILSEAKDAWVLLSMILLEVLQVGSSVIAVFFDLLPRDATLDWTKIRSRHQVLQACRSSFEGFKSLRKRLKDIAEICRTMTKEELNDVTWSKEDLHLLNEISSSLPAVVMLELCEVVAPLIYLSLLLCLRSNTFLGHNSSYFMGLAEANLEENVLANSFSLLLEVAMFVVTDTCMRAVFGISFFSFIRLVLRCDFSFWLSTLSVAYVAWLTMLVQHTGHDLTFQFSWLAKGLSD